MARGQSLTGHATGESSPTVDIPIDWDPQRNLADRALRVAFADFSAAPWQGFEKSERGPNNSSLFRPQAAVVVVAVLVPLGIPPNKKIRRCKASADFLVGCPVGLEPTVSRSTIWRVNRLRYGHHINAPEGTRTPGPLLRRQLLYPPELRAHVVIPLGSFMAAAVCRHTLREV